MAYTPPTIRMLQVRYPAFACADEAVIQYWLDDAARTVDESWSEGDFAVARMALAAHNMARQGVISTSQVPAGVTDFKSGSFSVSLSSEAATIAAKGGFASTIYGQEFAELLRANKGGPRVVGGGAVPCGNYGFNGYAGPLPPYL